MPTPAERKALLFVSGITLLGAGVRAVRAAREAPAPDAAAVVALERQIAAVDSVRAAPKPRRGRRGRRREAARDTALAPHAPPLVDLDRASAQEIERLPRIGPVLAARIVADRDSLGPFGSIENFQRVRGVGPALARFLAPRVTFSLRSRPSLADGPGGEVGAREARRSRRPRPP